MKVVLSILEKYPYRIQLLVPTNAPYWITQIQQIKHLFNHGPGHYSMPYGPDSLSQLSNLLGASIQIDFDQKQYPPRTFSRKSGHKASGKPKRPMPKYQSAVDELERWIILKQYSRSTLKAYKHHFTNFLLHFNHRDPKNIEKEEIVGYLYHLAKTKKISESSQNQIINAIKCYYEKVLGYPRTFYELPRPKRKQTLPDVLNPNEIQQIMEAVPNLKHRAILMVIYSGGLRLGEVLRLRLSDIKRHPEQLFIKGGKNKKDRYTLLSQEVITILEDYKNVFKPKYWLFEGQTGGAYSASSVQQIFRRAVAKAGVGDFATLHTLRHSFATHLVEAGVDSIYIRDLLGHVSLETTSIYLHVARKQLLKIMSPMDRIKLKPIYPQ